MDIGIIGSGDVAQSLGRGFAKLGYNVTLGTRNPQKLNEWIKKNAPNGHAGSFEDAAKKGEMLVLAVAWGGVKNAIRLAGKKNFDEKILIDTTNPLRFEGDKITLISSPKKSGGAQVQKMLPKTKVVKAFNMVGAHIMISPRREEGVPDLLIAGNYEYAKKTISNIAERWGWGNAFDLGDINESYWLEAMAMVWMRFGTKHKRWSHAFKLLLK
jgi:predicted dinucleotide-binding enzyme